MKCRFGKLLVINLLSKVVLARLQGTSLLEIKMQHTSSPKERLPLIRHICCFFSLSSRKSPCCGAGRVTPPQQRVHSKDWIVIFFLQYHMHDAV